MDLRAFRILMFGLTLAPGIAHAKSETTLVVISSKARGGPNLKSKLRKMVEKPLKRQFNLLKLAAYKKAGKKVGVKGKAIFSKDAAVPVGSEVGATHVLIIEGQMEKQAGKKKRKKKVYFAEATLIEVATGDVVWANRIQLKGKKMTPQMGSEIVNSVSEAVKTPAEPPAPPEEDLVEEPIDPPPPPDAPPPPEDGVEGEPSPEESPFGSDPLVVAGGEPDGDPIEAGTETDVPPESESIAETPMTGLTASLGTDTLISVSEPIPTRRRKRWRPALHVGAGAIYMWRKAVLSARNSDPPAYEGPLPGGFLKIDFFPLALGGNGAFYEGIGLHLEGQFYPKIETIVDEATGETVSSRIIGASGGLSLRIVFWDSATAPDVTLKAGYGIFFFPLDRGPFPGTRYKGPYAGGAFNIPFSEQVGLVLGGAFYPRITPSGKLKKLGDERKVKPTAFRGEGGLRLFFDPFEILLVGRFEQFDSRYKGPTELENSVNQYENVKLRDRMFGGFLIGGAAF
ncbi:MAG: hypothetical protein V3T05_02170 [Myxococcota bacterium]